MTEMRCNLCQGKNIDFLLQKFENRIVKCRGCGLIFVYPQPNRQRIIKFYQKRYFTLGEFKNCPAGTPGAKDYFGSRDLLENYFNRILDLIEKKTGHRGKILDVGSELGIFLNCARGRGWWPYGVEISAYAANFAKEKFGLEIFNGELDKAGFKTNFFDLVCLFQTLEHVTDPHKILMEAKRVLKKGGFLAITTPDINSLYTKILGKRSNQFNHQEHLYYFNRRTLAKMLKKAGFKKISIQNGPAHFYRLGDIFERVGHFYPQFYRLTDTCCRLIGKTFLAKIKLPVFLGDILAIATK